MAQRTQDRIDVYGETRVLNRIRRAARSRGLSASSFLLMLGLEEAKKIEKAARNQKKEGTFSENT